MFKKTTAQSKIASLKKRVRIVQGGSSASKTFSIIPLLITYAIDNPATEISIVAETIPHLRRGAIRDFIKIMDSTDNFQPNSWNKSSLTYYFQNGSFIEFFSADNPSKLRGARRDILFINECNNVDFESYMQLSIRTRKFIYLDYNPTNEFWVHKELLNDKNTSFIKLTYKDNEALEQSIINELESKRELAKLSDYWANWVRVYLDGEIGSLQGVVFDNWEQTDLPTTAKLLGYGMDFGFTNDPTTLIGVYLNDGHYYFDEIVYQTGLTNSDFVNLVKPTLKAGIIYADSAEPKSIEEIRRMGINIIGAVKGSDSVMYGINLMQQKKFYVTKNSLNLVRELRSYTWMKDKTGATLNRPIDANNHAIDAIRYYLTSKDKYSGKYR
jgi:phage terminase large subunit